MLTTYIDAAMQKAKYEILKDRTFYGYIDELEGVYANANTLEQCREELESTLEDWLLLKVSFNNPIPAIDGLELKVNNFADVFADLQSKEFSKNIVKSIEGIQKDCEEIEQIIDERIRDHIQNNILATSWVDSVSNDLQTKIEQKTPLILDLFNCSFVHWFSFLAQSK